MYKLVGWQYCDEEGSVMRGQRTEPRGLPVIMFMHGNGLCGMTYWPMLQQLCEHYDVLMLDAAGHGCSDAPESFQGWEKNAELFYRAWVSISADYPNVKKHAVGHSFGGILGTIILAEHPGFFDSAVLLDPVYFPPSMLLGGRLLESMGLLRFHKLARTTRNRRDQWPSLQSAREHLLAKRIYAKWESACFEAYLEHGFKAVDGGVQLRCDKTLEAAIYSSMPYGLPGYIRRTRTPCIVYSGDQSYDFVVTALPKYCSGHSFIEHREISGSHNFMLEQTRQTASWIRKSLSQLNP